MPKKLIRNPLITLSTFIIGIIISQREIIGINVLLLFPLIGVVFTMVCSFILGVEGMVFNSMENRILAFCLLLSIPIFYATIPILVGSSGYLTTLELQITTGIVTLASGIGTILLAKVFTNWFRNKFPLCFDQDVIVTRIGKRIMLYVTLILFFTFLVTIIIFCLSFQ